VRHLWGEGSSFAKKGAVQGAAFQYPAEKWKGGIQGEEFVCSRGKGEEEKNQKDTQIERKKKRNCGQRSKGMEGGQ